jgi:methyl-accepting chemotaxis protein
MVTFSDRDLEPGAMAYPAFRLKMVVNSIVFMVISIMAQKLLNDFANFIAYQAFDLLAFISGIIRYFALAVVPCITVSVIVIMFFMLPFSASIRTIGSGGKVSVEGFRKALMTVVRIPYVIIILNVLAFVVAFVIGANHARLLSLRGFILLCQYAAGGFVCAYVQIVVNNLILAKPRAMLKVRYIGKFREPNEGQRSMLISISLAVYTMFTVVGVGQAINDATVIHARISETMATKAVDFATASAPWRSSVASLLGMPAERVTLQVASSAGSQVNPLIIYIPILAFLVGLAVFIQLAASRNRLAQFKALDDKLHSIIEGSADLTQRVNIAQFDELGFLSDSINLFIGKLKDLFAQFSEAGEKVATSSETLRQVLAETTATTEMMVESIDSTSSHAAGQAGIVRDTETTLAAMLKSLGRISENVDTQASSVEQTSAAVTEMAANIQAVGRATTKANEVASGLSDVANDGKSAVDNAARAAGDLEAASSKVNAIVQAISKISAQTNLLAMNAAIEAAHAGEAGAGFAVVASEVRSLAESSAASAKDIAGRIKEMMKLIEGSVRLSGTASSALERISRDIGSTTLLIDQIASGMDEQSKGANEIVEAMSNLLGASHDIRKIAEEQKANSVAMSDSIQKLVLVFTQIQEATAHQAAGNSGIIKGITHLQAVATENQEVVGRLQQLLQGFVLHGTDQSVIVKEGK